MKNKNKVLGIRLTEQEFEALGIIANEAGYTKSEIGRSIIVSFLHKITKGDE